jgi:hypothetical protein
MTDPDSIAALSAQVPTRPMDPTRPRRSWPERRKRAEPALITVVADSYLAGVSTRRMDKLVKTLGIDSLSKSQVSRMTAGRAAPRRAGRAVGPAPGQGRPVVAAARPAGSDC